MAYLALLDNFQRFDVNEDGTISAAELRYVLQVLDAGQWTDETVDELLTSFDTDLDGRIQYEEFFATLMIDREAYEVPEVLKDFAKVEPPEPDRQPSKAAKRAHDRIVKILQSLDAKDAARVRAGLMRDFKQKLVESSTRSGTFRFNPGLEERWDEKWGSGGFGPEGHMKNQAHLAKLDYSSFLDEQIAKGVICRDEIQFEPGEQVWCVSSKTKDPTSWFFMEATVDQVMGKLKVNSRPEHKTVFYTVNWWDNWEDDILMAQERMHKLDGLFDFAPGEAIEVETKTGGWTHCKMGGEARCVVSTESGEREWSYRCMFPKGKEPLDSEGEKVEIAYFKDYEIRRQQIGRPEDAKKAKMSTSSFSESMREPAPYYGL